MTGSNVSGNIAGGPIRHISVMLNEVLACLSPAEGKTYVDGTFGAGGYSKALLNAGADVFAIDRDPNAIRDGQDLLGEYAGKLTLKHGEFSDMAEMVQTAGLDQVDGVVLDIGVSSMQLDQAERGFSFQKDGPLDMRMSQSGPSAADVVNMARQSDLTRIIGLLGEEKRASAVSREIVAAREIQPFETTLQLVNTIEKAVRRRAQDKIHPATRTFQALRVFVNRELHQLADALFAAEKLLKAGGRLVVVTFHSLEDRIVKLFFKDRSVTKQGSRHMPETLEREPSFLLERNGLIKPSVSEAGVNTRARSAKLRWGTRTAHPSFQPDASIFGLPNLIDPSHFRMKGEG
ncbi:MAG: 16S rRNA (cytosine(1402)-N(4))-methyltransferase RsmH [Pseudomonadota bacterium]